jgi:hypothetical protein
MILSCLIFGLQEIGFIGAIKMKATFPFFIISALIIVFTGAEHVISKEIKCPSYAIFYDARNYGSWRYLYKWFTEINKVNINCDDGAAAEAYDDFVVRSLALHWDNFGELLTLTSNDKEFEVFILRHIGASAHYDDLHLLLSNALERCPANGATLCSAIIERADKQIDWINKSKERRQREKEVRKSGTP